MALKKAHPNGLRRAMKQAGIGPTELADRAGTSKQNIQRWADGDRKLIVPWAVKLAPLLHTTPEELLLAPAAASVTRVPLLEWVQAGKLSEPVSQIPAEEAPKLSFADLGPGEFFALKVEGNSMDRVSPEGAIIVVNRADRTLVNGKPYVFAVRGKTTYKLWRSGDPEYLAPYSTDPANEPVFIHKKNDLEVIGRVRRSVLDL